MSLLSFIAKSIARITSGKVQREALKADELQQLLFKKLIASATNTQFGKEHHFSSIAAYSDFKKFVPIRDYEALKPWIEKIILGRENILWPGLPKYMSKTSGTTSGVKYIPITQASIPNHIDSTRRAMLCYIAETGKADFLTGKLIFISGSPALEGINGIKTGRLSGIVNHHVPGYLKVNQLPSWETNCIEDFETKIAHIVDETIHKNMTMISGIPPWVQMYFDKLIQRSNKSISELYPNFSLFIYGGVNFEPYRKKFEQTIGRKIDSIELYPASEGFIAFQDSQQRNDLLLNINSGIFFEFVVAEDYFKPNPNRIALPDVVPGVNYAIIISTNAGLWAYSLGDTVKFTSKRPYRLVVTGRIKHFISAFGEHVIAEEVEQAMVAACNATQAQVVEFTVAPQVAPVQGLPFHEWIIAFAVKPNDEALFASIIDQQMQQLNIYYRDLIAGGVLQPAIITQLHASAFINYMRSQGKLGGQNKVPRLSNDRTIADGIIASNK
ncbi:MAG: hypothetical protein RIQ89_2340 [Bacteroidota bacterium]|jgi:hypothetical protein